MIDGDYNYYLNSANEAVKSTKLPWELTYV